MEPLRIALLGGTGSIGQQTLSVIKANPERFRLQAVSVGENVDELRTIVEDFQPKAVGVVVAEAARSLSREMLSAQLYSGEEANVRLCERVDVDAVVIAMPGMQAIHPLLAAAKAGKRLAVANKECLVCGGDYVRQELKVAGAKVLPIDSEQNAIFQCLNGLQDKAEMEGLILTASGGPFRDASLDTMRSATPKQALAHPNWAMGRKISIDSATLINKGLEVIEAHYLFDVESEKIGARIHPQSIVHSMIRTVDGAVLAQLGEADMRLPIQYALSYPERLPCPAEKPHWQDWTTLTFQEPDAQRFPGLPLAYEALRKGGTATAVYNGADEVAVEAFLQEKIGFLQIADCVAFALAAQNGRQEADSLETILAADAQARRDAWRFVEKRGRVTS